MYIDSLAQVRCLSARKRQSVTWKMLNCFPTQPITLKLSGKVIPNRIYRTPLSEYGATYDKNDPEKTGIPLARYEETFQGEEKATDESLV
jgi:hypothetical protein